MAARSGEEYRESLQKGQPEVWLAGRKVEDVTRGLSERSTPDWALYCEAAFGGFNAIVTRDFTQAEQAEEMVCLSYLRDFHVISWRQRMEDPISEWGQLLAYLPAIRRFIGQHDSRVIFLPVPTLATDRNVRPPKEFIGRIAKSRGQSVLQVRREAIDAMRDWETSVEADPAKYTGQLLAKRSKP